MGKQDEMEKFNLEYRHNKGEVFQKHNEKRIEQQEKRHRREKNLMRETALKQRLDQIRQLQVLSY